MIPQRLARHESLMLEKVPPDLSKLLICPMPGMLVKLHVAEGETVQPGQQRLTIGEVPVETAPGHAEPPGQRLDPDGVRLSVMQSHLDPGQGQGVRNLTRGAVLLMYDLSFDHRQMQHQQLQRVALQSGGLRFKQIVDKFRNTVARARGEYDFSHEVMEAMEGCMRYWRFSVRPQVASPNTRRSKYSAVKVFCQGLTSTKRAAVGLGLPNELPSSW